MMEPPYRLVELRVRICIAVFVVCVLLSGAGNAFAQFTAVNSVTGDQDGASAPFPFSTAVGTGALAGSGDSTAIGASATAGRAPVELYATAVGSRSVAGQQGTALGFAADATGPSSTALGGNSFATADSSTAVGSNAQAGHGGATVLGFFARSSGANATAIGLNSSAGQDALAVGKDTRADFANSTAIGNGAQTTAENQMMFGTAANTYTAPGITSGASRTAQIGPRQIVTTDASGNLASDTAAGLGLASFDDIGNLHREVGRNTEGVAMAMALSGIPVILPECTNYAVSANWGTFGGENGVAVGGSARLVDNLFFNGGVTIGTGGASETTGGRAGVTWAW